MKNAIIKFSRVSITAGLALGLVSAGIASRHSQRGEDAIGRISLYDNPRNGDNGRNGTAADTGSGVGGPTTGGTGMGGSGIGTDTSFQRDTSFNRSGDSASRNPSGYPGTGIQGYPSNGGTGSPTGSVGDSSGTGLGGSRSLPGMDSLRIPTDTARSIDSMGVPDWDERG